MKLFVEPYSFFMANHFFTESFPVYDENSFDKPNEYDPDYENYPYMHVNVQLNACLISFYLK